MMQSRVPEIGGSERVSSGQTQGPTVTRERVSGVALSRRRLGQRARRGARQYSAIAEFPSQGQLTDSDSDRQGAGEPRIARLGDSP